MYEGYNQVHVHVAAGGIYTGIQPHCAHAQWVREAMGGAETFDSVYSQSLSVDMELELDVIPSPLAGQQSTPSTHDGDR